MSTSTAIDYTRWRLKDDDSRHTWHYLVGEKEARDRPQTYAEKYFLNLPLGLPALPQATSPIDAAQNGLSFFEKLQLPSGHWACQSGGPMIFLPGVVIAWYITRAQIPSAYATEIRKYLSTRANHEDGGWGLHIDGHSNVCCTALNYTALRLLGVPSDDPVMEKARGYLHHLGGAINSSIWGKFWLAVLGVMDWDIVNPIPPEIWLVPDWLPIAPWRFYIEIRMASQSMSYLYSKRLSCKETDIIRHLKKELFVQPYTEIMWASHRNSIAEVDNLHPRSRLLNAANWVFLNIWKPYLRTNSLKQRAESWVSQLIDMEDLNTNYSGIAATNAPMNTIVCYFRDGPGSPSVKKHIERLYEFMWMGDEGMLCHSTNGVQCWDTAFFIQAVCRCGLESTERWKPVLLKALNYLERQQIRENCKDQEKCYRQPRKGGWAFSNQDQGVAVSDCIAEALKAIILLQKTEGMPQVLEDQRIFDAVDALLLYQNDTGGVSAFESRRGGEYLEVFNLSEIFGRFMVEYDYPECTTSCVTALALFNRHWPYYRTKEIQFFITRATSWIKSNQRIDGSWYGSWGICFTYAAMFALESMASVAETYANSSVARMGCDFLISKQREDGGWSESFKAIETMEYHEDSKGSLVVQTAWALIGLMEAEYPHTENLKRGIQLIMRRQQGNGEWLHEAIEGAFHNFSTFSYPNYKFTFTIKALGMFTKKYPNEKVVC